MRRKRKTSLRMRQMREAMPVRRRLKSVMEILMMPTDVKKRILQVTPSWVLLAGETSQRMAVARRGVPS